MSIYSLYKSDFKANLKLAIPIMIGQLGQVAVNIADNIMVGKLGSEALAAVALSIAILAVFLIFGMGISFALPPVVAEADGRGDRQSISFYFKHCLLINVVYAVLAMLIMEFLFPLLYHIGQNAEVVDLAIPYLRLSIYSLLPFMLFQTLRTFSDGKSETIPPMIAMISGNILNIGLNYLLIFGHFGFPNLGVEGAAMASLMARIFMFFLLAIIVFYWKDLWQYIRNAEYSSYQKATFKKLLNLGIPTSLQNLFEIMAFSGSTILMGLISIKAQAAHQIALNLITVSFMVCIGLSVAGTIRVGNQLGKRDIPALRKAGFSVIIQAGVFMGLSAVVFLLTRHFLPTLYIKETEVVELAAGLLILAAIFQVPDGVQAASIGALRGLQDIKIPTLVTFIAYILIGLPLGCLFAFQFDFDAIGIWLGLMAGLLTAAILNTWRFQIVSNKL